MGILRTNPDFWKELDSLIFSSEIKIDRPKGSVHPRYKEIIYPLDYGYLANTTSPDGDGIDVWLGSLPEKKLGAILINADSVKRDSEIKLLIGCTGAETEVIYDFYNRYPSLKGLLVFREENE